MRGIVWNVPGSGPIFLCVGDPNDALDTPLAPSIPDRVRPAGVPPAALWVDSENEWQLRPTDDAGLLHGPFRSWRADGSLRTIASHRHGKQVGAAWRFHPDGSLLSFGNFVDGSPHGVHRRYASLGAHAERLQSCCVPPGAWQLRQTYARGESLDRGWFNRDGVRLLETGEPYPDRPAAVPPQAWFNENSRCWETRLVWEEGGPTGTRRRWSTDGVLRLVEDLVRGKRHGTVQSFNEDGALAWQAHFVSGRLSGGFTAWGLSPGHFVDPAVRQEDGTFTDDQAEGVWRYFDDGGAIRHQRDLGTVLLDEDTLYLSPVLENERRSAAIWRTLAESLFAERRVGEALLGAARASAEEGDPALLRKSLDAWTMPLGSDAGRVQADDVVGRAADHPVPLIDGIKRGGDAPVLLCAIAKALRGRDRAALDFVTAGLLLSPEWTQPLATRALLHGSLGDVESARADAARVGADSPEQGDFLELYLRVSFPRFDFWPAREAFEPDTAQGRLRPERTLPEVRDVIQRYATRIARLRQILRARVSADVPFMIPDLAALLPDGPATLSRWTFCMSADDYEGHEPSEEVSERVTEQGIEAGIADGIEKGTQETRQDVTQRGTEGAMEDSAPALADDSEAFGSIDITVDEGHGLALETATVPHILQRARADWSGLVWLCWAVGLDAPGLPDAIRPPAAFTRAAVTMLERAWRCRDKLNTAGLLALTKGIPGFEWEGTSIDLIPAALAAVALDEYVEARAVFSWLCDPANRSPWQEDLRGAE